MTTPANLEVLRTEGDAPADAFVAALQAQVDVPGLERLLYELFGWIPPATDQAVPQVVADFEQEMRKRRPPDWVRDIDLARVERGQALFRRLGSTGLLILGCASLPHCYSQSEVANTLILSGRLASQVRLRIRETWLFVNAVMAEGALQPGGNGLAWITKVRLMHAIMRELTRLDPEPFAQRPDTGTVSDVMLKRRWTRPDAVPLDQIELAFVQLTFSIVVLDGWRDLGIEVSREERDDYLLAWAFIGSRLGIREELLPGRPGTGITEARALLERIQAAERETKRIRYAADPSDQSAENGRLLVAALLVLMRDRVMRDLPLSPLTRPLRPLFRSLPRSLIRHLVGRRTARELWVEPAPLLARLLHWILIDARVLTRRLLRQVQEESPIWQAVSERVNNMCSEPRRRDRA